MRRGARISVIIPALNEEASIGKVVSAIPAWVDEVVVVDNGSLDGTAQAARAQGAWVVVEPERGYGSACLAGIAAVNDPDVVVFMDGDYSDQPEEMALLVDPIIQDEADLVAGSRVLGRREKGSLAPQARFGNWLACALIRLFWKASYTDLGPFRAIRTATLRRLGVCDRTYGWIVEMQIKATCAGVRVREAPVSYRRRIGKSKITGTIRGVLGAATKILLTIFRAALASRRRTRQNRMRLILFTRYPEPGKAKTRLIPALGLEGAARLQRQMTERTLTISRHLEQSRDVSIEVRYEGGNRDQMRQWLGVGLSFQHQGDGDLGVRMARAFRKAFQAGMRRVMIIGTDCPGLTAELLQQAFDALEKTDLVLGPATDGGYYLVGLRRELPELFEEIPWGTDEVLELTMRKASQIGLRPAFLESLDDIDRPEDLQLLEAMKISVA